MSPSSLYRFALLVTAVVGVAAFALSGVGLGATADADVDLGATVDGDAGLPAAEDVGVATPARSPSSDQPTATDGLALPERLELSSVAADGTGVAAPDAGTAIRLDGLEADSAYEQYLLEERLDRADTDEAQRGVLEDAVESSNATVRAYREREREARQSYESGDLSASQFLRELSVVDAHAAAEEQTVTAIHDSAGRFAISGIRPRAEAFLAQLQVRQGSIRADAASSIVAEQSSMDVYVASGGGGTVLATTQGSSYEREATRDDRHVATLDWGIDSDSVWDLKDELYPRFTSTDGFTSIIGSTTERHIYRASGSHDHGELVSYVDAHSESVVREDQELRLGEQFPTLGPQNATNGSTTVSVERTYPSGPAKVTVFEDGAPASDEIVRVDDDPVALTGDDGEAWVILPYDDPTVSANANESTATTQIQWASGA